jgi:DNA processing protein
MNKVNKLTLQSDDFPEALRHIPQPPSQLYVQGSTEALLAKTVIAVVGSRKITPYGREVTGKIVTGLAPFNISIVSGLAFGVDITAHKTALAVGMPTVAVLPCGLDKIYPVAHRDIAKQIVSHGGALVSEYEPSVPPLRQNFVERNRIVSGLSTAVLITEAAKKSGTLHTARFALEQGKSVLAVPGNITSQMSQGTNNLIAQGARAARHAQDVLDECGINGKAQQQQIIMGETEAESRIIALLQSGVSDGKTLLEQSNLSTEVYAQTITMLEISDKIKPLGADHWAIR